MKPRSMFAIAIALASLSACISAMEAVVSVAYDSHMKKLYDVAADFTIDYNGRTVTARRYYEFYHFWGTSIETHRSYDNYSFQGLGIVRLSEDAAIVVYLSAPNNEENALAAHTQLGMLIRMSVSDGQPYCTKVPDYPYTNLVHATIRLTRLPPRLSGYPNNTEGFHVVEPPSTPEQCIDFMRAGDARDTISP